MAGVARSSRPWRRARAAVLAYSDVCWLCGQPGSTTVDHVTPLADGGHLTDPTNLRPAHKVCNSRRGARAAQPTTTGLTTASRRW